ncbi:MAG: hypothetical protein QOJ40_1005 [Verrucomicrobiota bacterium]
MNPTRRHEGYRKFGGYKSFAEADAELRAYWQSRTPQERMEALETLRIANYGEATIGEDLAGLDKKFLQNNEALFLGRVPNKIEVFKHASGLEFSEAYPRRVETVIDGEPVKMIGLADLKTNKRATGRNKDLADLDNLP